MIGLVTSLQEAADLAEPSLLYYTVITTAFGTSPRSLSLACPLLMSIPLNVIITHLKHTGGQKNDYTLVAFKKNKKTKLKLYIVNTHLLFRLLVFFVALL